MFPFSDIGVDESRSLTDNLARFYDILAENALDETEKHGLLECLLYLQRQESIGFQRRTFVDLTGNHGRIALAAGIVFGFSHVISIEPDQEHEDRARQLLRSNLTAQVEVYQGSFLSASWLDSDVVYFDACCLGELDELLIVDRMVKICSKLLPGTYVVICSRWPALPPHQHLITVYETTIDDLAHEETRHAWVLRR